MSTSDSQTNISLESKGKRKRQDTPPPVRHGSLQHRFSNEPNDDNQLCEECELIDFSSICDPENADQYRHGCDVVELGNRLQRVDIDAFDTQSSSSKGLSGRVVDKVDYAHFKECLKYCQLNHGAVCNDADQVTNTSGLKVIDCEKHCVVFSEPQMPYVALSYVWGTEAGSDLRPESHPLEALDNAEAGQNIISLPDTLPAVIKDAIEVTKNLGLSYLWVDRYCIDQKNPVEKHDQIQKMNLIYTGAAVTIIAAAGDDGAHGLPGVANRSRHPQPSAKEAVLSRRKLVFTDHQAYFECNVMNSYESFSAPLDALHHADRKTFHTCLRPERVLSRKMMGGWGPDPRSFYSDYFAMELFKAHVKSFTARSLSYDSDILNAFTGIAQALRIKYKDEMVFHFWGVPFELRKFYDCETVEDVVEGPVLSFFRSLLWDFRGSDALIGRRNGLVLVWLEGTRVFLTRSVAFCISEGFH
ncbi:HET-domain-containing protein [Cadophora sp. DSE1049]|nr:HET-domain-containing protein [Cadophora sp. DSE1049]